MKRLDETNIKFGGQFMLSTDQITDAKMDLVEREKQKHAIDLGLLINKHKQWQETPQGNTTIFSQKLYVFTEAELKLYAEIVRRNHDKRQA